jgi:membrane-associated phospholipid phosphatase
MKGVLIALIALTIVVLVVFAIWPGLDLAVADLFFSPDGFAGQGAVARWGRDAFRVTPFVALAAFAGLYLARRFGLEVAYAPSFRAMVFLAVTMSLGPGVVVNLGFKDHWHRPRPINTEQFGGAQEFRPWYRDDGACYHNCSFVSGEAATGFWMVAPAMVLPPPVRGPAIVAAFAFGVGASWLRLAFGAHYLSDVVLGGLFTLIIIAIAHLILWPRGRAE